MSSNRERTLSVLSLSLAIFVFWVALYTYVPILPTYARAQGASDTQVGLILSAYGLTQLILRLPLGLLSDRLRRKKVFALLGALLVTASGIGLALARTPTGLYMFRALSGGAATAWVVITVLYNSHFSIEHAVRTSSQLNLISAISQILAMAAGGLLAEYGGAQATFWASALLSLPALAAFAVVHDVHEAPGAGITLTQFKQAITTPRLLLVSALAACSQYALFGSALGFVPVRAQDLGASDAQLGFLTTAVQAAKAVPMLILSVRGRGHSERLLTVIGLALIAGSLFAFPFLNRYSLLVACQVLMGLGVGLIFPVLMGLALQAVAPEARASAMGVFQSVYALGMTLGPSISGVVSRNWGIDGVFLSSGVLLVIAMLAAAALLRPQRPSTAPETA